MRLSVVIIARNEESTMGRSLEAMVQDLKGLDGEIVLVDSASSDRTVSIAESYPVRIIRLEQSPLLSPAAGRYIGTRVSKGEFIFFLDGDMVLISGWLAKGLEEMRDPQIAGVAGRLYHVNPGEEPSFDHPDTLPLGEVTTFGGAAVYRRAALDACGTFNPYIKGEEEAELGHRLRSGGYRLKRIAHPMAYHMDKVKGVPQVDQKAKYHTGTGQILRRYPGTSFAMALLRSKAMLLLQELVVLGTPVLILLSIVAGWYWLAIGLSALAAAAVMGRALWKGPRKVLLYLRTIVFSAYYTGKGFLTGLPSSEGFEKKIRFTVTEGPTRPG